MFIKKTPLLILFLLISIVSTSQASSVSFNFTGKECLISLQNIEDSWEHHNYVSLVFDAKYIGKLRIKKGATQSFPIKVTCNKKHHNLTIYKKSHSPFYFFINNNSLVG